MKYAVYIAWVWLVACSLSKSAWAQDMCESSTPMSKTRLLRRLSLDLRGYAPSMEELTEVKQGRDPMSFIEPWLASEDFVSVLRAHHESLLWPNLEQIELVPQDYILYPFPMPSGDTVYLSPLRSLFVRTTGPVMGGFPPCLDEPATFDQDGDLILRPLLVGTATVAYQEGWIELNPVWAPDQTIKVCALDALEAESAPVCPIEEGRYPSAEPVCQNIENIARLFELPFRGTLTDCNGPFANLAPGCACGNDLRRCQTQETLDILRTSLRLQMLELGDRVIREDRPYHEMLTEKVVLVNGPIAHYLRHQSRLGLNLFADPDEQSPFASIPLTQPEFERWLPLTREGRHAGVLTTPAYLMRHAVGRQRAHRFYNAFECSSFTPRGPLPSPLEACSQRVDLTERCGCADCHQTLEPMAAHWGRFAEYGFMALDNADYPAFGGSKCRAPYESIEEIYLCSRLYELEPVGEEEDYLGFLNAYVFRSPEEAQAIEQGPASLVERSVSSGRFSNCAAERMWTRLMHRSPTFDERRDVLPELVSDFEASEFDLKGLVRAVLSHPAYGRAP